MFVQKVHCLVLCSLFLKKSIYICVIHIILMKNMIYPLNRCICLLCWNISEECVSQRIMSGTWIFFLFTIPVIWKEKQHPTKIVLNHCVMATWLCVLDMSNLHTPVVNFHVVTTLDWMHLRIAVRIAFISRKLSITHLLDSTGVCYKLHLLPHHSCTQ